MVPATSERNFTPSSTALSGPPSTTPGTVLLGQIVTVEGAAAIVRLKRTSWQFLGITGIGHGYGEG